jgi:hypothetical protein
VAQPKSPTRIPDANLALAGQAHRVLAVTSALTTCPCRMGRRHVRCRNAAGCRAGDGYVARENAVGDALTVSLLDSVVAALDRGGEELAGSKQHARRKMDAIVGIYDA